MKTYDITIKLTQDYLQDRFTLKSQEELTKTSRKTTSEGIGCDSEAWRDAYYQDEKGCYIPSSHIEGTLAFSGKDFKVKAKRSSMSQWVKANLFCEDKIYINKKEPDGVKHSAVKRKDGSRVPKDHPFWNAGLQVSFKLNCMDDDITDSTIKELIENAGRLYGIGARKPKYGRFEVVEFKKE